MKKQEALSMAAKLKGKKAEILRALVERGSLTTAELFTKFFCTSAHQRLTELRRDHGLPIYGYKIQGSSQYRYFLQLEDA